MPSTSSVRNKKKIQEPVDEYDEDENELFDPFGYRKKIKWALIISLITLPFSVRWARKSAPIFRRLAIYYRKKK